MFQLLEATDVMPNPLGCMSVPLHTLCSYMCTSQACSCEHCNFLQVDEKPFPQLEVEKNRKNSEGWHWVHIQ